MELRRYHETERCGSLPSDAESGVVIPINDTAQPSDIGHNHQIREVADP